MKRHMSAIAMAFIIMLACGCRTSLVGTWDSKEITDRIAQEGPKLTQIRMVMTPQQDSFLILEYNDGSRNVWHSAYRTEGDQLFVQYLMDPEVYTYAFLNGNLIVENNTIKVVFERVK